MIACGFVHFLLEWLEMAASAASAACLQENSISFVPGLRGRTCSWRSSLPRGIDDHRCYGRLARSPCGRLTQELRGIAAKFPGLGGHDFGHRWFYSKPFWIDVFGLNCNVFCLLANVSEGLTMLVYFLKYFFTAHLGSFFDRKQLQQLVWAAGVTWVELRLSMASMAVGQGWNHLWQRQSKGTKDYRFSRKF